MLQWRSLDIIFMIGKGTISNLTARSGEDVVEHHRMSQEGMKVNDEVPKIKHIGVRGACPLLCGISLHAQGYFGRIINSFQKQKRSV